MLEDMTGDETKSYLLISNNHESTFVLYERGTMTLLYQCLLADTNNY